MGLANQDSNSRPARFQSVPGELQDRDQTQLLSGAVLGGESSLKSATVNLMNAHIILNYLY